MHASVSGPESHVGPSPPHFETFPPSCSTFLLSRSSARAPRVRVLLFLQLELYYTDCTVCVLLDRMPSPARGGTFGELSQRPRGVADSTVIAMRATFCCHSSSFDSIIFQSASPSNWRCVERLRRQGRVRPQGERGATGMQSKPLKRAGRREQGARARPRRMPAAEARLSRATAGCAVLVRT